MLSACSKQKNFDPKNGGIIFFRDVGTQNIIEFFLRKKALCCDGKCVEMLSVETT